MVTWSGLPLGTTRTAWHLTPPSPKPPATDPFVRLIPAFDEYLLGWPTRTPILAEEHTHHIYPGGGILCPAVLMNSLIRGTWKRTGTKSRARFLRHPPTLAHHPRANRHPPLPHLTARPTEPA
ncbi:DNA glycosylase AlkZ-like family protein [Nonomuraea salmonea]|uniref:DNA glycosylase AlkZ-like family protein n=1 Tax=Nonomuraea salmonea TaxID=46181 RepID=UPI003CD08DF9